MSRPMRTILSSSSSSFLSLSPFTRRPTTQLPFGAPQLQPYMCTRCLRVRIRDSKVPPRTPFVPDHATFLKLIGRSLSRFTSKFESWEELFGLSSQTLQSRGIAPTRDRRYLLRWLQKYRTGRFGIGGDMRFVRDGVAVMRVVELPRWERGDRIKDDDDASQQQRRSTSSSSPSSRSPSSSTSKTAQAVSRHLSTNKLILNFPADETNPTAILEAGQSTTDLKKVQHVKLTNGHMIRGPHVQPVKGTNGSVATLKVKEGLWEDRRGHKVDGGERRKAEVRFKRGVEERKKARV